MADQTALENYMHSLPLERVQDVVSPLEAYEDQFAPERVVPATVVLLNLLPTLPERQLGMFDLDTRLVVGRIVFRLVRVLKEPQAVETAVREILPQVAFLSSKLELITDVGYREGAGHKLVSESAAKSLEKEWRASVRAASDELFAREQDLLWTFLITKKDAKPDEPVLEIPTSPAVTHALLRSARSETRRQSMGSRAIRHVPRLAWEALIEVYGDEFKLRLRIEELKASPPENIGDLLDLADKYLAGYRPKELGDD